MLQALNLPKKVYFKPGCMPVALRELGDIYRCQRALLVTDPELYRAGISCFLSRTSSKVWAATMP